ncbi:hypothetical protein BJY04DRAFT_214846 [Aspergillus karnatakaensis]|uniref:2OG-Fe(II) oxygenase n=1 Tax=Aspergillus karnatakaensis TaxID=1810916 RepID=UPI003CCE4622
MTELEDNVSKYMIKSCKIDACVDHFLSRLLPFEPQSENWSSRRAWRDGVYHAINSVPEDKKRQFVEELQQNLDRLIPGYLRDVSEDILNDKTLSSKLRRRWHNVFFGSNSNGAGSYIPASLISTLAERQSRASEGLLEATSPEAKEAFSESCRQLRSAVEVDGQGSTESECRLASSPINVFWSKGDDSVACKLVLPTDGSSPEASPEAVERLTTDCDPASFGRGERDVLDPEYRRAGEMNVNQFATSFHPADFGILENVGQVLLPSISRDISNKRTKVYSGPSGHFRKHVDTPRSDTQIGSLVVCLPSLFKGGKLNVEHHGQKVEFDWSTKSGTAIQWAAFYSDCEHEIETITEGDRIILTYNLYVTEPVGGAIASPTAIVDPKTLPMYGWMKNLLTKKDFLRDGGVLGIFCSHAYPHTSNLAQSHLLRSLKGADLVLYSVFKSLGVEVEVLPVLETGGRYCIDNTDLGIKGKIPIKKDGHRPYYLSEDYTAYMFIDYLKKGEWLNSLQYNELLPATPAEVNLDDIDQRWKMLFLTRKIQGMEDLIEQAKADKLPLKEDSIYASGGSQIGAARYAYDTHDCGEGTDLDDVVRDIWPAAYLPGITWITEPKHEEMAFSQIAYGNEASIGTRYSCAAILAVIPPAEKRAGILS